MKTSIMSIPQCAASQTLKSLSDNKVNCQYMGVDQSGRILMQITFEEGQDKLIGELTYDMLGYEKALNEIVQTVNNAIEDAYRKHITPILIHKRKRFTTTEIIPTNGNTKN